MAKAATGRWSWVSVEIHVRTCADKFKFSIYYGQSTLWGNQCAGKLARWAFHEGMMWV